MGFFPLKDDNADVPMGSFSTILWESKPYVVGFLTRSPPLYCRDFPLLELLLNVLLIGFPLLGAQALAYRFPLSKPMGR